MRDFLDTPGHGKRGLPGQKVVVIAGGAGFVGSALCARLISSGQSVICVDNLVTGSADNIAALAKHPRFRFIRQDIISPLAISGPVDEIYNLACPASPPRYQANPIHTFRTSIEGSLNLLTLAERKGARILLASTSEIYGDPEISPQPESYRGCVNTVGPRACYDEGKRAAETLFWEYGAHRGLETRIARIFNTYGPQMDPEDGRVVSNFIVQSLRGQPLTVYGDGSQTRSFCYVDDLVEGLIRLMASDEKMPVNLGNPGEFTMLQLAELVQSKTGRRTPITFQPLPQDDPRQRRPDITRARDVLGWAPTVPLDRGLDKTIAWFAQRIGAPMPGKPVLVS
ncbi:UDP-glucuronic acid decarboxylase family protein [Tabrizicola sp. YIM 78059]|uniref:UDP-glucuronic acid decarboxylase family protein n=1 Tax=Tabrizicola sp. YIM 78059 TaxID=2529861 RepID=UPI0010AAABAD|nr:UDP-glucuronic acid decarboxylase family protein [Tabrizicola sp. YIM 78059]